MYLQLLQTARKAARLTPKGPVEVEHLLTLVVLDVHLKGPGGSTALPCAAVCVLLGRKNLLAQAIQHLVLVGCLKPSERLQYLYLLLDQQLVHHGQVLKSRWTYVSTRRGTHGWLVGDGWWKLLCRWRTICEALLWVRVTSWRWVVNSIRWVANLIWWNEPRGTVC